MMTSGRKKDIQAPSLATQRDSKGGSAKVAGSRATKRQSDAMLPRKDDGIPDADVNQPMHALTRRASTTALSAPEAQYRKLRSKLLDAEENAQEVICQLEKEKHEKAELLAMNKSLEAHIQSLRGGVESLNAQLKETKVELKDTRAHILSLQPFVRDISPEEVARDFDDLHTSVCNWVEKWLTPVFDDDDCCSEVLVNIHKNILRSAGIRSMMNSQPDLLRASHFPDTDQDVVVGMIMRFLHHEVFSKVLYDTCPNHIDILQQIEDSMRTNVQPRRDIFAVRNWRAEAFNSLVNHTEFIPIRDQRRRQLTVAMGKPFLLFRPQSPNDIYRSLDADILKPAIRLQDKIQTSIHHFYFELNPYDLSAPGDPDDRPRAASLLDEIEKTDCEDVLNNRKRFDLGKLSPAPSRAEILDMLYPICITCPRLMMRQVGRGDVIREPTVVRKQKVLVAWGPPESRIESLEEEQQTLMNAVYSIKAGRGTRGNENGFLSGWV
ncbi:hypothetical protein BJ170DRAFT_488820 [Xylariales sp. AK1849]|nr:hypothetical protein BJ170DRAFT_488820 [Xylariales sp. AK1849]